MLQFDEETIDWCLAKLRAFSHMPGFPTEGIGIRLTAKAVLRIAHPELVKKRTEILMAWKDPPADLQPTLPADKLDEILIAAQGVGGENIGEVRPLDWLIEACLDNSEFAPKPVEMRRIFANHFRCADGNDDPPPSDKSPGSDL